MMLPAKLYSVVFLLHVCCTNSKYRDKIDYMPQRIVFIVQRLSPESGQRLRLYPNSRDNLYTTNTPDYYTI